MPPWLYTVVRLSTWKHAGCIRLLDVLIHLQVYHPGMGQDMGDGSFDNEDAFYERNYACSPW